MIVLIVDAFSNSKSGRFDLLDFVKGVKQSFVSSSHTEIPTSSGPTQFIGENSIIRWDKPICTI